MSDRNLLTNNNLHADYNRLFKDVEEVLKILRMKIIPEPLDADYIFNRLESLNGHEKRVDIVVKIMEMVQPWTNDQPKPPEDRVDLWQFEDDRASSSQGKSDNDPFILSHEEESNLNRDSHVMVETLLGDNFMLDVPSTSKLNAPAVSDMDFGAAYGVDTLTGGYARRFPGSTAALGAPPREDGQDPEGNALQYAEFPNHRMNQAEKRKLVNDMDTNPKRIRFADGALTSWAILDEMLNASFAADVSKSLQKTKSENAPATHIVTPHGVDAAIDTVGRATIDAVARASLKGSKLDEVHQTFVQHFTAIMEIFPDADPDYMLQQIQNRDNMTFDAIVQRVLDGKNYPKLADIMAERARDEEIKKYKNGECTAEDFLQIYEDPVKYFYDETRTVSSSYTQLAAAYLWKEFGKCKSKPFIQRLLEKHNNHYVPTFKELQNIVSKLRRNGRHKSVRMPKVSDVQFYKEFEFVRLETGIKALIKQKKAQRAKKIKAARQLGSLLECSCCFDDCVLPEESVACASGHVFCKECITRGVDVALGQGKAELQCMAGECNETFSLKVLQEALPAKNFSNFLKRLQYEELQKANLEDLVTCPFCSFAAIVPNAEDKLFRCLNEECRKVTCRLCGEENHLPLRCDEIEKDSETKMRVFIEERMNEALIRTCPKCGKRFVKSDGCNMIRCSCGAHMCYVCRQPIKDNYRHFTEERKCNQYYDTQLLHQTELATGASTAKLEYLSSHPEMVGKDLKHDPTKDLTVNLKPS